MRIFMAIDGLGRGGKERRMLEVIKGLLQSESPRFEICLVSLSPLVEYPELYTLPVRFEILKREGKADLGMLFRLADILRSFKPDILHSWGTLSSMLLAPLKLVFRRPLINGVLADAPSGLTWADKHYRRVKLTTPFTDIFVSNSKAGIRAYRTPEHKSVTIYNGVSLARFEGLPDPDALALTVLGKPRGQDFIVITIANFDERKDQASVVEAALSCCRRQPAFRFIFIGTGPTEAPLKKRVADQGMSDRFVFAGRRTDVEALLQICDAGVLMTNSAVIAEGVSNAILEYQLSGLPVIGSRGGGTDEVIADGQNGFLIGPGDAAALEERLIFLEQHRDTCKAMGAYARNWSRANFNSLIQTKNYIALYQQLHPAGQAMQ